MVSRRALLLGAATVPLAGCSRLASTEPGPDWMPDRIGGCRTPDALTSFSTVGGAPLVYEVTGVAQSFRADPRFVELLDAWAADWVSLSGLGPLRRITTYGAFVDKCDSWHAAGRAFDFGVLEHDGGTVSCRYDQFGEDPAQLRRYWQLSASLAKWFTYTLTYRYNEQHHNHIHVDNGISGYDETGFAQRSRVQVMVVQGVVRHVFGLDAPFSGSYDGATRDAVREIQRSLGITDPLRRAPGWQAFLDAAVRG
ncbi:extensin family protein [Tessaracoccus flavus]|uniref:Extensin-like C-terminal domain-containing protein n=1 Tax=Tessaracoccus flavus TaxID=1610493 RepID=A0A1Q2CHR8_9ACTN|nr:extensin family protein [Tessaracoccus flavus]AQP45668.1 hypothetical protein RPIT_13315 [Tessaracoccus flavus]